MCTYQYSKLWLSFITQYNTYTYNLPTYKAAVPADSPNSYSINFGMNVENPATRIPGDDGKNMSQIPC